MAPLRLFCTLQQLRLALGISKRVLGAHLLHLLWQAARVRRAGRRPAGGSKLLLRLPQEFAGGSLQGN